MTRKLTKLVSFFILFVMIFNIGIEGYAHGTTIDSNVENQEENPGDTHPSDESEEPGLSEGEGEIEDEGPELVKLVINHILVFEDGEEVIDRKSTRLNSSH